MPMTIGNAFGPIGSTMKPVSISVACQMKNPASRMQTTPKTRSLIAGAQAHGADGRRRLLDQADLLRQRVVVRTCSATNFWKASPEKSSGIRPLSAMIFFHSSDS